MNKIEFRNCIFSFKCEKTWDELQIISTFDKPMKTNFELSISEVLNELKEEYKNIRKCEDCNKHVYFCRTDEDLLENIKKDRCVAIEIQEPGRLFKMTGYPVRR